MGQEIELKIPLTDQQYDDLYNQFYSGCKMVCKRDEYFSKYNTMEERRQNNEPSVIRIRTEGVEGEVQKSYFTIKRKKKENGIEINREDETFIENDEAMRIFFEEAGYHKWFDKEKKSYGCYQKLDERPELDFHMELVIVNDMKYMEIEVTDSKGLDYSVVQGALEGLVKKIGLDPSKKDIRSWYELINETVGAGFSV